VTGVALTELFDRNRAHAAALPADHFDEVQTGQSPALVSVCCSDSRVSQEGMFSVEEAGWLFGAGSIGNLAMREIDSDRVVDGSLLYPLVHAATETVAVVGHTGCGAITSAYRRLNGAKPDEPPGIQRKLATLEDVLADEAEAIDENASEDEAVNRLVEANVRAQIAFLHESPEVPAEVDVYGFVYDLHGACGDRGRLVLVAANDTTSPDALRELVTDAYADHVGSLG
jgi:carbonic anhydrase